jgi:hypothetical protein
VPLVTWILLVSLISAGQPVEPIPLPGLAPCDAVVTHEALRAYASDTSDIERFISYAQRTEVHSRLFQKVKTLHAEALILRAFLRAEFLIQDMEAIRKEIENGTISAGSALEAVHSFQSRLYILSIDFARLSSALLPEQPFRERFEESQERLNSILLNQIHPEIQILRFQVEFPASAGFHDSESSYADLVRWMMEQSKGSTDATITRAGSETTVSIYSSRSVQRVAAHIISREAGLTSKSNILEIGYGSIPILNYLHQKISAQGTAIGVDLHAVPDPFTVPDSPVRLFESKTPTPPAITQELLTHGPFQLIYGVDVFKNYSTFGDPIEIANQTQYLQWIRSLLEPQGRFVIINDDFKRPHIFREEELQRAGLKTLKKEIVRYKSERQLTYWVIAPTTYRAGETP